MTTTNTYRAGDIVRDCHGRTHVVIDAYGPCVWTAGGTFHPTNVSLVRRAAVIVPDPATIALAALARKRADRERERQLDEQSRAARGENYGIARLRTP